MPGFCVPFHMALMPLKSYLRTMRIVVLRNITVNTGQSRAAAQEFD